MQLFFNDSFKIRLAEKIFHHIQSFINRFLILQRKTIQRFSKRAPIGLIVLSITLSRLLPPSFILPISSKLRTVNLSRRTYLSSSIRDNEVICPICVCCVIVRYCRIAPEAMIPFFQMLHSEPFQVLRFKNVSEVFRGPSFP